MLLITWIILTFRSCNLHLFSSNRAHDNLGSFFPSFFFYNLLLLLLFLFFLLPRPVNFGSLTTTLLFIDIRSIVVQWLQSLDMFPSSWTSKNYTYLAVFIFSEKLNIRVPSEYSYLNQSECLVIGGVDDARKFHTLVVKKSIVLLFDCNQPTILRFYFIWNVLNPFSFLPTGSPRYT